MLTSEYDVGFYSYMNVTVFGDTSESVDEVLVHVFFFCSGLTSITIPNSLKEIEEGVFLNCYGLTSVTVGNGITTIAFGAFLNCLGLTELVCYAEIPPVCDFGVFDGIDKTACTLKVPKGSKDAYSQADQWKDYANIEEIEVTGIEAVNAESVSKTDIAGIYDLNGRRRDALQHGVNIVKMSDGTTRKVIKR